MQIFVVPSSRVFFVHIADFSKPHELLFSAHMNFWRQKQLIGFKEGYSYS